jgi:hypothetical protein
MIPKWQAAGKKVKNNSRCQGGVLRQVDKGSVPIYPYLKQMKWLKYKQNVQVGNVGLRRDEMVAGQTHK